MKREQGQVQNARHLSKSTQYQYREYSNNETISSTCRTYATPLCIFFSTLFRVRFESTFQHGLALINVLASSSSGTTEQGLCTDACAAWVFSCPTLTNVQRFENLWTYEPTQFIYLFWHPWRTYVCYWFDLTLLAVTGHILRSLHVLKVVAAPIWLVKQPALEITIQSDTYQIIWSIYIYTVHNMHLFFEEMWLIWKVFLYLKQDNSTGCEKCWAISRTISWLSTKGFVKKTMTHREGSETMRLWG